MTGAPVPDILVLEVGCAPPAGINSGEAAIRTGAMAGGDLAGIAGGHMMPSWCA